MLNFLSSTIIETMPTFGNPYNLNFIGKFIQWLLESLPNMGLGIIIFTLVLKLITLPLDIYSRVSMKKNNLKMERMRPQLEKLQRQYANNKDLYNQKMAALYKKEGYSALSSCLPTLVTLIVFIIVINQFSNYSNYANLQLIQGMAESYNAAIADYNEDYANGAEVVKKVGNEYYYNESFLFTDAKLEEIGVEKTVTKNEETDEEVVTYKAKDLVKFYNYVKLLENTTIKADVDIVKDGDGYKFNRANFAETVTDDEVNVTLTSEIIAEQCESEILKIKEVARNASKESYLENVPSFLWVKNIWVEDLPWKHPVKDSFSEYNFTVRKGCTAENAGINMEDTAYAELTYNLSEQKNQANGYLILVVLSIGVMILSTIISNNTQKAQMELQTADSTAAQTSKMMTWMMPIMFGIFAFIYTASFSIYMVVSSAVSTISTVLINKVVENRFNKQIEEERLKNDKRYRKSK